MDGADLKAGHLLCCAPKLVNKPNKRLGQRIQKIKDYLSLTPSVGVCFQRFNEPPTLSGYVDAAFASEDSTTSRVGYFFLSREKFGIVVFRKPFQSDDFFNRSRVSWTGAFLQEEPLAPAIPQGTQVISSQSP